MQLRAAQATRLLHEPRQQSTRVAAPARLRECAQIVDIQVMTPGEAVAHAKARDGHRLLARSDEAAHEPVAGGAQHPVHVAGEHALIGEVRAQRAHRTVAEVRLACVDLAQLARGGVRARALRGHAEHA